MGECSRCSRLGQGRRSIVKLPVVVCRPWVCTAMIVTHLLDEAPESNANFCFIGRCSQTRLDWAALSPFSRKLDVEISGPKGCSSRGKPWSRQDEPHLRPRGRNWTRGMGVCPEPWTINPRADSELHGVLQWFCVGYPVDTSS